jgi:teichoic acid transport system ATP-binding protein
MKTALINVSDLTIDRFDILKDSFSVKNAILNKGKILQKKNIFSAVNLQAFEGNIIGIMGKNGVGKTTLLSAIAGLFPYKSGKIETKGKIVPLLGLGHVFQPDLTIEENIRLWYCSYSTPSEDCLSVDEILQVAELDLSKNTPLRSLSSGMYSRLAFVIALNEKADIYLFDEIFAVGDQQFRKKSSSLMKSKISSGGVSVISSHDFDLLNNISTQIFELTPLGLVRVR